MNRVTEATECPAYHNLMEIKESECPTYHKILDTTVGILKKEGLEGFTIRRIAAEAKVNVAAINYHFQSKDSLLEAACVELARPLVERLRLAVQDQSLSPRGKLKKFLLIYGEMALSFPPSILHSFAFNGRHGSEIVAMKQYWIGEAFKITKELLRSEDQTVIMVSTMQLFSTIIFPVLMLPHQKEFLDKLGVRYPSLEEQVDILLSNFIKES